MRARQSRVQLCGTHAAFCLMQVTCSVCSVSVHSSYRPAGVTKGIFCKEVCRLDVLQRFE